MHSPSTAPPRLGEATYQRLIAAIHEMALAPDEWPTVLQLLGHALNCHCATAITTTAKRDAPRSLGTVGITADDHRGFLNVWHKRNVFGSRCPFRRAGAVVLGRDILSQAELMRSDMYQEYFAPRAIQEVVRLDVSHEENHSLSISLARPWSSGPFAHDELRLAHAVMPILQHAVAVQARLGDATALALSAMEALETAHAPIFIIDCRGRVVLASAEAERVLGEGDGLTAGADGLRGATSTHSTRLRALIGRATGSGGEAGTSGTIRLPRPSGRPDLTLVAVPLSQRRDAPLAHSPAVVLQVTDPVAHATPARSLLAEAFELTPAEVDLVAGLLRGWSVRELAARSRRSIATVRTHLANVLAKTGTARQSELVRLLMRLPRVPNYGIAVHPRADSANES